jgi:transposase
MWWNMNWKPTPLTSQALLRTPGIGILAATALFATIGSIHTFKSGRQLAC